MVLSLAFMTPNDSSKLAFRRRLRHEQTDTERKFWSLLRSRQLAAYKFRRQHPIGPYIVDFCCLEKRLIVELDGGQHADQILTINAGLNVCRARATVCSAFGTIKCSKKQTLS